MKMTYIFEAEHFSTPVFNIPFSGAPSGSLVRQIIQIQYQRPFKITSISGFKKQNNQNLILRPEKLRIQIKNGTTKRFFYNTFLMWDNAIGTAERPFYLSIPEIVKPKDIIEIQLLQFDQGLFVHYDRVQVTFHGGEI